MEQTENEEKKRSGFGQNIKWLLNPFSANDDGYIDGDEEPPANKYEDDGYEEPQPKHGFSARTSPKPDGYVHEYAEPPRKPNVAVNPYALRRYAPVAYDEVKGIAQRLIAGESVFLVFEKTDFEVAEHIRDFLSGVTFALDGQISRLTKQVYVFAPKDAGLFGFAMDEDNDEYDGQYL